MMDITRWPLATTAQVPDEGSACLGHRADGHVNAYPCLLLAPVAPAVGYTDGGRRARRV